MKLPRKGTSVYIIGLALFLIVFAYLLLTYTRRVDGVSMLPTLVEGDLVVVQSGPMSGISQGDVIVYGYPCSTNGESVIHRVIGVQNGGLITKGDNNPYTDQGSGIANSPITQECLVGKVVYVVPYIERLASLPYGTNYLLALLIIFAVLYLEFRSRGRGEDEERQERGSLFPELKPGGVSGDSPEVLAPA